MHQLRRTILLWGLILMMTIPNHAQPTQQGFATVENYTIDILNTYPHDPTAFTQGLLYHEGVLYESTGLRGESSLREVDIESGEVIRQVALSRPEPDRSNQQDYFAEGLERVGEHLIQLTWQSNVAFVYDIDTFEQVDRFEYDGQGWGLCYDQRFLYMSDSSQYIAIRDADNFQLIGRMLVTLNGTPLQANLLNELECVGDYVYANLWQTDFIVQIDKYNGNIVSVINAENLLTSDMISEIPGATTSTDGEMRLPNGAVLNGIAYNPDNDSFYITGKLWSRLFEVRFVPSDGS